MGIKLIARNNRFPQNINRKIERTTNHVKMEERDEKKSGQLSSTTAHK